MYNVPRSVYSSAAANTHGVTNGRRVDSIGSTIADHKNRTTEGTCQSCDALWGTIAASMAFCDDFLFAGLFTSLLSKKSAEQERPLRCQSKYCNPPRCAAAEERPLLAAQEQSSRQCGAARREMAGAGHKRTVSAPPSYHQLFLPVFKALDANLEDRKTSDDGVSPTSVLS